MDPDQTEEFVTDIPDAAKLDVLIPKVDVSVNKEARDIRSKLAGCTAEGQLLEEKTEYYQKWLDDGGRGCQ